MLPAGGDLKLLNYVLITRLIGPSNFRFFFHYYSVLLPRPRRLCDSVYLEHRMWLSKRKHQPFCQHFAIRYLRFSWKYNRKLAGTNSSRFWHFRCACEPPARLLAVRGSLCWFWTRTFWFEICFFFSHYSINSSGGSHCGTQEGMLIARKMSTKQKPLNLYVNYNLIVTHV